MTSPLLACGLSFFIGSIPFGVLIGQMHGVDVRAVGSGNIGATNVWRALGPKAGSAAFALDVSKGLAGPLIAAQFAPGHHAVAAACGIAAVFGHTFSPWLGFKGGKGIATSLGALLGLMPAVGLLTFAAWGLVLAASRTVSTASIAACFVLPALSVLFREPHSYLLVACLMSGVALIKHIPNMKRLASGTEPKLGQKKPLATAGELQVE